MVSKTLVLLGALVAAVSAVPRCKPATTGSAGAPVPTLPATGGATELPPPAASLSLKRIAAGHGIQNYTCASSDQAKAAATGALAVLYDITSLYPGTPNTGLSAEAFNALPTTILWTQPLPLNLQDPSAASAGTPSDPNNALAESSYGAVIGDPFPNPAADLVLGGLAPIAYLGHHYFDAAGAPTFDLRAAGDGLFGRVAKADGVAAPPASDGGVLGTGAVDWLRLVDDGTGAGEGVTAVYRVITAGGQAEPCSQSGAGSGSVPYTAMYWFYG